MNRDQLSERLEAVVNFVPEGAILADIGSDHAYLPCFAILHRNVHRAIAGEVVKGPFESAVREVMEAGLTDRIDVRFGSGLEVVTKGEATCITIAGMGGQLITSILTEGYDKLAGHERLVLQPNVGEYNLRRWLEAHQYAIIAETILKEDGKIYEVIVAEKSDKGVSMTEEEKYFGPILKEEKSSVFYEKWNAEQAHVERVLHSLTHAKSSEDVEEKRKELQQQLQWIKEELA